IDTSSPNRRYTAPSVRELIESIYETESRTPQSQARWILRHRIFSTETPTIAEIELVKSAAKRLSAPAPFSESGFEEVSLAAPRPLPDFFSVARERLPSLSGSIVDRLEAIRALSIAESERWKSDRPVSAILEDGSGRTLAIAWNTNAVIRNRHAEWNLCESLRARGEKIPAGATLFTSLKPCRMCAAKIWESAEDPAAL